MSKLNFKTISTLAIAGFLSIQSLNATSKDGMGQDPNPSTNPLVRIANEEASSSKRIKLPELGQNFNRLALLRAQVPVELQNAAIYCSSPNHWLMTYMCSALGCDTPILEALLPNLRPSHEQVQAFYTWVKNNPEMPLGFSDTFTQSIRAIASRYDPNVAQINLMNRQITTLPHNLWGLSNITLLNLADNQIVDVSPLSCLTRLKTLSLDKNQIVDVAPLSKLTQLTWLSLAQNQIVDVSSFRHLIQLKKLSLAQNQIVDVSSLSRLNQLETLYLHQNQIVDVSPLSHLTQLDALCLHQNQIVDVSPLRHLTQLTELYLHRNQIVDVSPLSHLTQLETLCLHQNQIVDVSPLRHLTQLTWLSLGQNQIVDVSPLAGLNELETLYLHQNQIVDVSPLAGLNELSLLKLLGNPATDRHEKQQRVQEYFTSNTQLYLKDHSNSVMGTRP